VMRSTVMSSLVSTEVKTCVLSPCNAIGFDKGTLFCFVYMDHRYAIQHKCMPVGDTDLGFSVFTGSPPGSSLAAEPAYEKREYSSSLFATSSRVRSKFDDDGWYTRIFDIHIIVSRHI